MNVLRVLQHFSDLYHRLRRDPVWDYLFFPLGIPISQVVSTLVLVLSPPYVITYVRNQQTLVEADHTPWWLYPIDLMNVPPEPYCPIRPLPVHLHTIHYPLLWMVVLALASMAVPAIIFALCYQWLSTKGHSGQMQVCNETTDLTKAKKKSACSDEVNVNNVSIKPKNDYSNKQSKKKHKSLR